MDPTPDPPRPQSPSLQTPDPCTTSVKNRIAAFNSREKGTTSSSVTTGADHHANKPMRSVSEAAGFKADANSVIRKIAVQSKILTDVSHINSRAAPVSPSDEQSQPGITVVIDSLRLSPSLTTTAGQRERKLSAPDSRTGSLPSPAVNLTNTHRHHALNNNDKVLGPLISELKQKFQMRAEIRPNSRHTPVLESGNKNNESLEENGGGGDNSSSSHNVRITIRRTSSPSPDEEEEEDDDATHSQCHQNTISSGSSMGTTRAPSMTSMNSAEPAIFVPEGVDDKSRKLYLIAQELTNTEKSFVKILKLLNEDFRRDVAEKYLPPDVSVVILKHLDELTRVSSELMKELELKLNEWPEKRKISDVIVKIGPFLSVYSFYMRDFEMINNAFKDATKKYPQFALALAALEDDVEKCKKLKIHHYLLKPVQRIPQYRLHLTDYLKHMSNEHPDHADTVTALDIVCRCADHANNMIKRGDSFAKLLNLQNSLTRDQEIIKPERVFIKDGELLKVSRKYLQPRFFVLCSDALLYLSQVQTGSFQFHHELNLTGMRVSLPLEEENNEFIINSPTRSLILRAKSGKERQAWYEALTKAVEENASRRRTFINNNKPPVQLESKLGEEYPVWVPDERVTMCQVCTTPFSLTYRRHHCRACGKVVCLVCSSQRVPLKYLNNRKSRVCDLCRDQLHKQMVDRKEKRKSIISVTTDSDDSGSPQVLPTELPDSDDEINDDHFSRDNNLVRILRKSMQGKKSVPKSRKVPAGQKDSRMRGNLTFRKKNSWKKLYFVIHEDDVLYSYKASEDVVALETVPLLGWTVSECTEPVDGFDATHLFEIKHIGQPTLTFKSDSPELKERWMKALRDASVLK